MQTPYEGHHTNGKPARSARYALGFWSLVVTQFQCAFNDNALKFLVIYLVVDMSMPAREQNWLVLVVGALFAFPFILFSMTGGFLADRFSKRSVTIGTKWTELAIMLFTLTGLARGNLAMEAAAVFLLSSEAAIFGPSKYGLLPELLPEKDLSWGNGVVELGTFLAAISATVASGFLAFYFRGHQERSGIILVGCTVLGLAASTGITRVPAANPTRQFNWNPLGDLGEQVRIIWKDRVLTWAVVGNFYLWFLAALLQFTIVIYGHDILRIDERHISYLQAAVAVGIGSGSLVTGYLSDAKIEYGLIPVGAFGMASFGFLSAVHGLSVGLAAAYLGLLGFFGGVYAVPLNALIQHRPDPKEKGGVIAAANLISFVGVFAAAGAYFGLAEGLQMHADSIFFAGACMTVIAALYAVIFLPDSVLRFALWTLTHTAYRIRVEGRDNIPERGSALFLVGELNLLDAIFLAAATDRPIRFVADEAPFSGTPHIIWRVMRITSANHELPGKVVEATAAAFAAGEVLCLTAQVVSTILQTPAREHMEALLRQNCAPIVGLSITSAARGPLRAPNGYLEFASLSRGHVTITFDEPVTSAEALPLAWENTALPGRPAPQFSTSD